MLDKLFNKLEIKKDRYEEIGQLLSLPETISNGDKFRELSKEFSELESIVEKYELIKKYQQELIESQELIDIEDDPEIIELTKQEINSLKKSITELESELNLALIPKDPRDSLNAYLEVRAGTGGDEAAIFAGDLFRMYLKYAEQKKWQVEIINLSESEQGGYKEAVAKIVGENVYGCLKFESGAHRVQRVPVTESQGRVHTSACTVAILSDSSDSSIEEDFEINPQDLRIDTFRASGAGGQHVNRTDSAVRLVHLPTNTVVECQEERSQHKNKAKAMSLLKARIMAAERAKREQAEASTRKSLVGSGDRSERIRTYNFPQGRVTDHRINLTLYKLEEVINGDLDSLIIPLQQEYQLDKMRELDELE